MKSLRHHIHDYQYFNLACLYMDTILFKSVSQMTHSISSFYFSLSWLVSRSFHSTLPHFYKKWMTVIRSILLIKNKKRKGKERRKGGKKEILEYMKYFAHKSWCTFLTTSNKFASLKHCDEYSEKSVVSHINFLIAYFSHSHRQLLLQLGVSLTKNRNPSSKTPVVLPFLRLNFYDRITDMVTWGVSGTQSRL